jgi:AraC-like DNA-binding protein
MSGGGQMLDPRVVESAGADPGLHDSGRAMVCVDLLYKFPEVVAQLGGDANALLSEAQIDPSSLNNRHAVISHRTYVRLLERAAVELACPDFGMRLTAAQGGVKVLGPLGYVMRNSRTVREAFRYCAEYVQGYSTAVHMCFEDSRVQGSVFVRIEIPRAGGLPKHPQRLERALLSAQQIALNISGGRVRAREIWITHEPVSPLPTYRQYFGAEVSFGQQKNGLVFADSDLDLAIPKADPQVYELATNFIEHRFPATDVAFTPRIRTLVERLLFGGDCTHSGVASMLGIHPRALQRRLRAEGESFEGIKDGVRREIALRYLKDSSIPLIRVAKMLGYSETSALSRSCYRWFSASPRQVRGSLV